MLIKVTATVYIIESLWNWDKGTSLYLYHGYIREGILIRKTMYSRAMRSGLEHNELFNEDKSRKLSRRRSAVYKTIAIM